MKEQYQKEISQIHVPAELLEKTKIAMKAEEKRLAAEPKQEEVSAKKKVVYFVRVSMAAAAAVLLLLVVPAASNLLKSEETVQDTKLHLSGQKEVELHQIQPGTEEE